VADVKSLARDAAPLVLRLALGAVFVFHGSQKLGLQDPARSWDTTIAAVENFAAHLTNLGIEPAGALAWATALTEFLGGAFLILGFLARLGAIGLMCVMAVAIQKVHGSIGFGPQQVEGGGVQPGYEFNVVIIAAALAIVLLGPGPIALDRALSGLRKKPKAKEKGPS